MDHTCFQVWSRPAEGDARFGLPPWDAWCGASAICMVFQSPFCTSAMLSRVDDVCERIA
jgi:hypothetical protein